MMETQPQPNTTISKRVFDVVLIRFLFRCSQLFLDSFRTCLASVPHIYSKSSGVVLCSDLESRRKTAVDGLTNLG